MQRTILRVFIGGLISTSVGIAAQTQEVVRIDLKSDPLATPVSLGEGLARVAAVRIEGELSAGHGTARICFDSSVFAFDRFGDAVRQGDESIVQRTVSLTTIKDSYGRTAIELDFEDEDEESPRRWILVLSDGTAGPHRLLVSLPEKAPDPERPVWEFKFEMHGLPEANPPIPVAPRRYPAELASPDSYGSDGRFHRFEIDLTGETRGEIVRRSREIRYDVLGEPRQVAADEHASSEFELQAIEAEDSTGAGRRSLRLKRKEEPDGLGEEFVLVLAGERSDSHRLLILQEDKVRRVIPLHDTNYRRQLNRFAFSQGIPASEREAIEEMRRRIGDRFVYYVQNDAITQIRFDVAAAAIDDVLPKLPIVDRLSLGKDTGVAELPSLVKLPRLRHLGLDHRHIDERGLETIGRLFRLRTLTFIGCTGLSDAALRQFAELPDLEGLRISLHIPAGEKAPDGPTITDEGVASLAGKTKLKDLEIDGYDLSDASLETIAGLKALEGLDLSGERITDAGVSRLTSLTRLRSLYLYRTSVSDAAIERLKRELPNLRIVHH